VTPADAASVELRSNPRYRPFMFRQMLWHIENTADFDMERIECVAVLAGEWVNYEAGKFKLPAWRGAEESKQ